MDSEDSLVIVKDVTFCREDKVIFDKINMHIPRGKITAIMGPSGCGKSTLLQLIGGRLKPASGCVEFDGINIHSLGQRPLYALRRRMGLLFQEGGLFSDLSVYENVAFALREHYTLPEPILRDLVLMKLEMVGLRGAKDLMPAHLSGGMARRVAMARALALDPELMMYDEPFAGQDPITLGVLLTLIKRLNSALELTTVLVSHDVPETLQLADYLYVIYAGKVIAKGEPDEVSRSQAPEVQQFLHGHKRGELSYHYPASDYFEELLAC